MAKGAFGCCRSAEQRAEVGEMGEAFCKGSHLEANLKDESELSRLGRWGNEGVRKRHVDK